MNGEEAKKIAMPDRNRSLAEEYIDSTYQILTGMGREDGSRTMLVQHRASGRIAVQKQVFEESISIYQNLRQVNHPNLVKIYETCQGEGKGIVIEEFISGETLESRLEDGCLSEEKTTEYTMQILDALQEIHARNIIHRDLTPSNVLISSDDVIKLIDFGISRSWKENKTKDTAILGTVGYASPEQFGFLQTDITTDFYALGVLINVMLTGAFPNETMTDSRRLGKIVKKCTQIDPAKRYQSTEEIRQDLTGGKGSKRPAEQKEDATFVPGFRSNVGWKKTVGAAGYLVMALYALGSVLQSYTNIIALLLEAVSLLLFLLTFFVGSNFLRWDRRMPIIRSQPREVKIMIRIFLCMALFLCAAGLDSYVKYEILNLPRSSGT